VINPELDLPRWRRELASRGRAQLEAYLQPEAAEALHQCLDREVPWTLAYREGGASRILPHAEYRALDAPARAALFARCHAEARAGYAFAYESYMMVRAYKEGRDPGLLLHRVLEFFNAPDYLAFARALTGEPRLAKINAQATCYREGMFLRQHNDFDAEEGRQYAYVLNLSR
jgi:SM-20-related protein